ncbi:hypothetical protein CALCODRAFT_60763 [Calocera cornea HHB12733]|uniref:Uncharacterized protein n=1 Tax=Calocera cornea HHB12733 TaxID=1353952 RepID=A0A165DNG4_9BASI|nr:hypothetical protein CALCODRAFT_60763 [Calocera cornea HHB12733]
MPSRAGAPRGGRSPGRVFSGSSKRRDRGAGGGAVGGGRWAAQRGRGGSPREAHGCAG